MALIWNSKHTKSDVNQQTQKKSKKQKPNAIKPIEFRVERFSSLFCVWLIRFSTLNHNLKKNLRLCFWSWLVILLFHSSLLPIKSVRLSQMRQECVYMCGHCCFFLRAFFVGNFSTFDWFLPHLQFEWVSTNTQTHYMWMWIYLNK